MSGPRTRWPLPQQGPGQRLPGSQPNFRPNRQTDFDRAVRFNGVDASGLEITSSPPGPSNWSIGLFFHIAAAPTAAHNYVLWMLQDTTSGSTPTAFQDIEIDNTRAVGLSSVAGDTALFTASLNVWYFVGVSIGSGSADAYFGAARNSGGPLTHLNIPTFTTTGLTPADLTFATDNFTGGGGDFPLAGRLAGLKVYNGATLSAADWYSESLLISAVRTSNIYGNWQLKSSSTKLVDSSTNARNLSARGAGTWTDEEGPFVPPNPATNPAQVATPTGISQATAVGTPTLVPGAAVAHPTGIAQSTAVGTPTGKTAITATHAGGIAQAVALGTPTLVPGPAVAHPTGIAQTVALGTPTLHPGALTAQVTGIAQPVALGTPVGKQGSTLFGVGIAEATAVGTPTAHTSAIAHPTGISQPVALGTPTLHPGAVVAHPTGIAQPVAIGTPTGVATAVAHVTGISQPVGKGTPTAVVVTRATPTGIAQPVAAGTPTLVPGAVTAHVTGISQPAVVGTPFASHTSPGQRTIIGVGVAQPVAVGTPTLVPGRTTPHGVGIAQPVTLGTPTGHTAITAHPTGISQPTAVGTPTSSTRATLRGVGIAQVVAVGTPTLVGGHQTLVGVGIAQGVAVGTPEAVQGRDQTETLSGTLFALDALAGVVSSTEQLQGLALEVETVAGLESAPEELAGVAVQSENLIGIADPSQ